MTSTFAPASAAAMAADRPAVPLPITSTSHSRVSVVFSGASTFAVMDSGAPASFSAWNSLGSCSSTTTGLALSTPAKSCSGDIRLAVPSPAFSPSTRPASCTPLMSLPV